VSGPGLLVVAGEASGDQRAAQLIAALRRRIPDIAPFGLASQACRAVGVETIADSHEIAVVGIAEALRVLPRAAAIFGQLLAETDRRRPAAALLVDAPDFNLRLARKLAWRGIPVIYYVSPQVWAWRQGRIRTIADCVDEMLVLFPFEVPFYRRHGVAVTHVGHPLVDEVPRLPQAWDSVPRGTQPERYRIALLPGSRRSEIRALLPTLLAASAWLSTRVPVQARLILAPSIPRTLVEPVIAASGVPVEIATEDRLAAVADSHLALCASGTATLETGLVRTPMLVCYRLSGPTWTIARRLVRVPHVSLVNLVLDRRAVPELLQHDASPSRIAAEALSLLGSRRDVERMRGDLAELRIRLGDSGASERAAARLAAWIEGRGRAA
jgi:lipid-A-disaccharide synthase